MTAGHKKIFEKKSSSIDHKITGIQTARVNSKGAYRSHLGYKQNLQSSSAIQYNHANTYIEKAEKPRGMLHVGDTYHQQVIENRVIHEKKQSLKF